MDNNNLNRYNGAGRPETQMPYSQYGDIQGQAPQQYTQYQAPQQGTQYQAPQQTYSQPGYVQSAAGQQGAAAQTAVNPQYSSAPQQYTQYQAPQQSTQYQTPQQYTHYQTPQQGTQYQAPQQHTQYQTPQQYTQYQAPQQSTQYQTPQQSTQYQTPQQYTQYQAPQYQYPQQSDVQIQNAEAYETTSNKKKKKKENKRFRDMTAGEKWREIGLFFLELAIMAGIFFILVKFVFILAVIPSSSMENTLLVNDKVFGNRLSYVFSEPERGDIVIFKFREHGEEEYYIKRLIGLPGDTITIRDAKIYINDSDTPLEEPYLKERWKKRNNIKESFVVPEGCYFFLGDNRNNSEDSRYWRNPYISREDIVAKAICIYWPVSSWKMVTYSEE